MATYTGRRFWVLDPRPEEVCIEDIARALSMTCRFGGHCEEFYSVAQHSIFVSQLVGEELEGHVAQKRVELLGLLHDAAEAYVGDMVRPVKYSLGPEFKDIERRLQEVVYDGILGKGWDLRPTRLRCCPR